MHATTLPLPVNQHLLVNLTPGRPTPLTLAPQSRRARAGDHLKREDLLAHKTNQVLGQALLAKRMGKTHHRRAARAAWRGHRTWSARSWALTLGFYTGAKTDRNASRSPTFSHGADGAKVIPSPTVQPHSRRPATARLPTTRKTMPTTRRGNAVSGLAARISKNHRANRPAQSRNLKTLPDAVIACVVGAQRASDSLPTSSRTNPLN